MTCVIGFDCFLSGIRIGFLCRMLCCVASPGIHPELRSVSEAVATGVGVTEAEA